MNRDDAPTPLADDEFVVLATTPVVTSEGDILEYFEAGMVWRYRPVDDRWVAVTTLSDEVGFVARTAIRLADSAEPAPPQSAPLPRQDGPQPSATTQPPLTPQPASRPRPAPTPTPGPTSPPARPQPAPAQSAPAPSNPGQPTRAPADRSDDVARALGLDLGSDRRPTRTAPTTINPGASVAVVTGILTAAWAALVLVRVWQVVERNEFEWLHPDNLALRLATSPLFVARESGRVTWLDARDGNVWLGGFVWLTILTLIGAVVLTVVPRAATVRPVKWLLWGHVAAVVYLTSTIPLDRVQDLSGLLTDQLEAAAAPFILALMLGRALRDLRPQPGQANSPAPTSAERMN